MVLDRKREARQPKKRWLRRMAETTGEGRGRTKIKRLFQTSDGTVESRAQQNTTKVIWEFVENDHRIVLDMAQLEGGLPPEGPARAAAAFGFSTAAGNAAGGETNLNAMIEAVEGRVRAFMEGEWSEGRSSGPNLRDLVAAWADSRIKRGVNITAANREAMMTALKLGKVDSKVVLADAAVKAELDAIKAKRMAERAAESAAAAQTATPATDLDALVGVQS